MQKTDTEHTSPSPRKDDVKLIKVTIGNTPTCSCSSRAMTSVDGSGHSSKNTKSQTTKGRRDLCRHVIFVLVKVCRVPASNPIVWQSALVDREIEEILRCREAVGRIIESARKERARLMERSALGYGKVRVDVNSSIAKEHRLMKHRNRILI